MRQYRFKSDRVYKRRRTIIMLILVTIVILAGIYVYREVLKNTSENAPVPTATTTNSPENLSEQSPEPEDTPTPTPTPEPPKGTMTEDHGFLPAIGSVEKSGKMDLHT